jgi:hypothetical protein
MTAFIPQPREAKLADTQPLQVLATAPIPAAEGPFGLVVR